MIEILRFAGIGFLKITAFVAFFVALNGSCDWLEEHPNAAWTLASVVGLFAMFEICVYVGAHS